MVDLTALRNANPRDAITRPWGRDFRPVGIDDVQVTTPGAPSILTVRYKLGDVGPFGLLSVLGLLFGAMAASAIGSWLEVTGWAVLWLLAVGMLVGWYLLGRLVTHVLSIQVNARRGLPLDMPLTVVAREVSERTAAQRNLIDLLEDAGAEFMDSDGELDEAFMLAVAFTTEALDDPRDDAKTAIARRHLETLARPDHL